MLIVCLSITRGYAQLPHTHITYGMNQGLNVKTTQVMLQDRDGFIWLATWDGLCRFDGYTFKTYKAHSGDGVPLGSNRFIKLKEGTADILWLTNYDMQGFCFNKMTETFTAIPYSGSYMVEEMFTAKRGDVWMTTRSGDLIHTTIGRDGTLQSEEFYSRHLSAMRERPLTHSIYEDSKGTIWLLTSNGLIEARLNAKDSKGISIHRHAIGTDVTCACEMKGSTLMVGGKGKILVRRHGRWTTHTLPVSAKVNRIQETRHGNVIIATSQGLVMWNPATSTKKLYQASSFAALKDDNIEEIIPDSHGDVWLQNKAFGIVRFTPSTETFHHYILYDPQGNAVTDSRTDIAVHEDIYGQLFVHPSGGGLGYYDRTADRLVPFYNPQQQNGWCFGNRITTTYADRQGNLWYATYYNGLQKASFENYPFRIINNGGEAMNVRATYQDRSGRIWVGCKDRVIRVYDSHLKLLGNLCSDGTISLHRQDKLGMVYAICQDSHGSMWLGTKGDGLIEVTANGLYRYQASQSEWSLSNNDIYDIKQTRDGRLWIATFKGGLNYLEPQGTPGRRTFINHRNRLHNFPINTCDRIRQITPTPKGELWISTTHGLLYVPQSGVQPEKIQFRLFTRDGNDPQSLTTNDVHGVAFNKSGNMYVLTYGGGFCKFTGFSPQGRALFKHFVHNQDKGSAEGIPNTDVPTDIFYSMAYDGSGNMWMSSESSIMRLSAKDRSVKLFPENILANVHIAEGPITTLRDGRMLINTLEGVLTFHPDSMYSHRPVPKIVFTGISLTAHSSNDSINIRSAYAQLYKGNLTLSHSENSFNIEFAALDFCNTDNIRYAYRLEGFDHQWNYTTGVHSATYTNMPHGTYTLCVRSTNGEGMWVDNEEKLTITVMPAWWETPLAYVLYVLAAILLLAIAIYLFSVYHILHSKVRMEQQLADIKLRFFTDVSHELRTPLTLISAPIEEISRHGNLNDENRRMLDIVQRNVVRMQRLVGQILDFRKIQNGKMRLTCREIPLCSFVQGVADNFAILAQEHGIRLNVTLPQGEVKIWADADKLEKIIFNLLSNAFKYTPDGKSIGITVSEDNNEAFIKISDEGVGIAEEKQKSIFNRFENLAEHSPFGGDSTGIGLSLVKQLVTLHNGSISVRSKKYEGSTFTITLHKGTALLPADTEYIVNDNQPQNLTPQNPQSFSSPSNAIHKDDVAPEVLKGSAYEHSILIVEDNDDLRHFLRTIFCDEYTVYEAKDGEEGLRIAHDSYPDIIISDVMMPNMNGIAMLHAIRHDISISHIPVVLLTAKADVESQIEGLAYGADDYITKPFSALYLRARLTNILQCRSLLHDYYLQTVMGSAAIETDTPDANSKPHNDTLAETEIPKLMPADNEFIMRVGKYIREHIADADMKIEDIAEHCNMSRTPFFKKVKNITGKSPLEVVRTIRMDYAEELLKSGEHSIKEVAYTCGYNDIGYFSKVFKQHFGYLPTKIINNEQLIGSR